MMRIRHLLMASALGLALPTAAAQADTRGLYIGGAGGADFAVDAKARTNGAQGTVKYDTGATGSVSVGYGFGAFRAELEGNYRENDVSGVKNSGSFTLTTPGGETRTWGVMVNGFYDINTGTRFTPYVGVGVGAGFVHNKLTGGSGSGTLAVYDGNDTTLAYQGIAGVSYAVSDHLAVTADYRYFATTDAEFTSGGNRWKVENANHVVTAGLRWAFGAPAVATAISATSETTQTTPPPAPTPSNEFLVFFDWDKSNLTTEARKIIADATDAAGTVHPIAIVVTGHTDTSGSPSYNQRLSERRADAVRRELVHRGIAPSMIQTIGRGETELMTPTADGVREPSNRRAQIVLRIG